MTSDPPAPVKGQNRIQRTPHRLFQPAAVLLALALLTAGGAAIADSGKGPRPGKHPLAEDGRLHISEVDRCPVCGMKVSRHAEFAAAIQLKDRSTYYFCGTGCMIRSWMHPETFLARSKEMLLKPVARDYFSGRPLDARTAVWVAGSDIVGPMGPALVPLQDDKAAAVFMRRHGGHTTFRLNDLDDQKWLEITGKKAVKSP